MTLFFAVYFYLLRHPFFPVTTMPLIALDSAIGFEPGALYLYASLWLYVSLPPALQATRSELIYYGWTVGGLCVAGLGCFIFWPTVIPPENIYGEHDIGLAILKGEDAAGNACPSLHVATAVFSAMWLNRQLFEVGAPNLVRVINWLWCVGIAYSTLATKQHVAVDVFAGVVLGMFAATLSLAWASLPARQVRAPVESGGQVQP